MTNGTDGPVRFRNRSDAGEQLATAIDERGIEAEIVLAIPRGGLPLGRAVADSLGVPLDIVVASKIGAPDNPEFALGAAASDGSVWLDHDTIERLEVTDEYLEQEREREADAARTKARRYRRGRDPPDLTGQSVVIVDDGAATGSTAIAAIRLVRAQGAGQVVLAVPVGPPDTIADLRAEADAVVCLATPAHFQAVGQFYDRFNQVSDDEAIEYLEAAG